MGIVKEMTPSKNTSRRADFGTVRRGAVRPIIHFMKPTPKPAFTLEQERAIENSLRDILGKDSNPISNPLTVGRMYMSLATTQPFTIQNPSGTVAFVRSYVVRNDASLERIKGSDGTIGYRWIKGRVEPNAA